MRTILSVLLVSTLCVSVTAEEENNVINGRAAVTRTVGDYSVHYPVGRWELTETDVDDNLTVLRLTAKTSDHIVLSIAFMANSAGTDAEYENNPNFFNTTMLLPMVNELTGGDDSRCHFTVGQATLPGFWDVTSRATVALNETTFAHVEACHQLSESTNSWMGAILETRSVAGQIQDNPEYANWITEAYAIIQNVETPDSEEDEDEAEETIAEVE
ncbi:MAG: hypothetical protein R3C28_20270 [Pirellulaceae bacterium]